MSENDIRPRVIASVRPDKNWGGLPKQVDRIYDLNGVAPSLLCNTGGNREPKIMTQEPINVTTEGAAYTLTARYSAMCATNVVGGGHYPMTAVCERDEELPPLPQNLDTKRVKGEPRIIQKYGDRGTSNYSVKGISNTIPANPMSDRGQLLVEPQSISTKQDKMKENNITVTTCAQRGRETGQRLEAGGEVANALTTVQKDSMVIESATVTTQVDSSHLYFVSEPTTRAAEELRQIAQEHRSCKVGVNIMNDGALRPFNAESRAKDSISEYCTDSSSSSTVIAAREGRVYGPETRYRIRKLTPRECFRLMDVDDEDIDKIQAAGISKTQQYKLAGNSIVVSCLYHIFRTMFIDDQPKDDQPIQLTLFD